MLRRKFVSVMLAATIGLTSILGAGCGFVSDLRIALASSGPLVSFLVNKGVISQEKADFVRQDFGDAVDVVIVLESEFKAAAGTPDKLAAALKAQRAWRLIYERGHFGVNPAILDAANITDAIFSTIVAYYGGRVAPAVSARLPKTEKQLAAEVKAKAKLIKEKLRVE